MPLSRRSFLRQAGATALVAATAGHGGPLRRELKLTILNPDEPVHDTRADGFEYPPSLVRLADRTHVFAGSELSHVFTLDERFSLIRDFERLRTAPRAHAIGGFDFELIKGVKPFNTPYTRETVYWRKTYCGVFDAHRLPPEAPGGEATVLAINHCENKNEIVRRKFGTVLLQNSVDLNLVATPETSSGPGPDGRYRDFEDGYFPFVTAAHAPVTAATRWGAELHHHDLGPILWPRTGYLTSDGKRRHPGLGHAHPHPSSLIAEDPRDGRTYLYVWCLVAPERAGAHNMIMAARAPIASRGRPGSFVNFHRGDYTEPSLPAKLRAPLGELLATPGGAASPIHPTAEGRVNRFAVARLKRSGLFLAVESYYLGVDPERYMETAFRLSADLRTWTDRFVLPGSRVHRRQSRSRTPPFMMFYPKFLSADGTSHTEIDEAEPFYLLASKPHTMIWRRVQLSIG